MPLSKVKTPRQGLYYDVFRPKWRNWQTRRTQNPVPSGECGFDSHLRHYALLFGLRPKSSLHGGNQFPPWAPFSVVALTAERYHCSRPTSWAPRRHGEGPGSPPGPLSQIYGRKFNASGSGPAIGVSKYG